MLHIVDEATRFFTARFLPVSSTDAIWNTILLCWMKIHTGFPHTILVDQGSNFGKTFADIGAVSGVEVKQTGTEAHWSLNVGKRYHEPLRTTYRKL